MTAMDMNAVLLDKGPVCPGVVRMAFGAPGFTASPGQFLEMEPSPEQFPMTRRPFTINRLLPDGFEVVFEVRGRGTALLEALRPGDTVRTLGPLGRGWTHHPGRWLLVGGGMGAAGFPFLAGTLAEPPTVLIGASTAVRLLSVGGDEHCITVDGTNGRQGLITDLIHDLDPSRFEAIAVCGPVGMMHAVWNAIPAEHRHKVQVSAESRMGCGWGVCEGCVIPSAGGGYRKCCTDGPVFRGEELDWDRWTE